MFMTVSMKKDDNESTSHSFHNSGTLTLVGVAQEVSRCGYPIMDKKQYITYEVMCTTFLLGSVDDGLNHAMSLHAALHESHENYND